jgi:hypothetical protein
MKLNGLEKAIKVLEGKYQQDESKDVEEVLDYLKSLKPELPKFVIDWLKGREAVEAYNQLNSETALDDKGEAVRQWFWDFWERADNYAYFPSWVVTKTIVNMGQFGATVKEDDLYYIRAPKEWDEHETPYVCIPDCVPDAYALTMHRQYAEKFTKEEAVATMRKLRVNWHLEKVK